MNLVSLNPEDWSKLSNFAHLYCFNEKGRADIDEVDFVLMVVDENEIPCTYMTCKRMNKVTVYMQHGGAFPGTEKSIRVMKGYQKMIDALGNLFEVGTTLVENTNQAMIKLAMKVGGLITGTRYFDGKLFLEFTFNFSQGVR